MMTSVMPVCARNSLAAEVIFLGAGQALCCNLLPCTPAPLSARQKDFRADPWRKAATSFRLVVDVLTHCSPQAVPEALGFGNGPEGIQLIRFVFNFRVKARQGFEGVKDHRKVLQLLESPLAEAVGHPCLERVGAQGDMFIAHGFSKPIAIPDVFGAVLRFAFHDDIFCRHTQGDGVQLHDLGFHVGRIDGAAAHDELFGEAALVQMHTPDHAHLHRHVPFGRYERHARHNDGIVGFVFGQGPPGELSSRRLKQQAGAQQKPCDHP